jgi:hypothetical protein
MLVHAIVKGGAHDGAWSTWTVLEDEDLEDIAWECSRQVVRFLHEARCLPYAMRCVVLVETSQVPLADSSTTARE